VVGFDPLVSGKCLPSETTRCDNQCRTGPTFPPVQEVNNLSQFFSREVCMLSSDLSATGCCPTEPLRMSGMRIGRMSLGCKGGCQSPPHPRDRGFERVPRHSRRWTPGTTIKKSFFLASGSGGDHDPSSPKDGKYRERLSSLSHHMPPVRILIISTTAVAQRLGDEVIEGDTGSSRGKSTTARNDGAATSRGLNRNEFGLIAKLCHLKQLSNWSDRNCPRQR
jgi:hypothetical protein